MEQNELAGPQDSDMDQDWLTSNTAPITAAETSHYFKNNFRNSSGQKYKKQQNGARKKRTNNQNQSRGKGTKRKFKSTAKSMATKKAK